MIREHNTRGRLYFEDFLMRVLTNIKGIPTDIKYDPYKRVYLVEYIKIKD